MTLSGASKVTIEGSIIEGNTQSEFSCVQLQTKATLFVSNTLFRNNAGTNFASAYGGAISASASVVDIGNCTFINNTAAQGGSVFMVVGAIGNPRLTITDSHFEGNAAFLGGAIAYGSATDEPTLVTITIARSTFKSNVADNAKAIIPWIPATGGALYIQSTSSGLRVIRIARF
jgi:predicted outer membrane repeat protein